MNYCMYIIMGCQVMGFQRLIALIILFLLISACALNADGVPANLTSNPTLNQTTSLTPTLSYTPTLISTKTPTLTKTTTPTPTITITPTPTFSPTPIPTLIGGFNGNYITVEGSQQQREIVLWNTEGEKLKHSGNPPPT